MWLGPLPLLCDRRDHRVGDVMTGVRIRCEAWSLTGGMRVNVERYQRHALTPHAKAVPRYRLTRRPCGGGCACGRGARAQNQQQNRSQPEKSQPNHHQRNPNAASARRGHGHGCRGRSGRPCRRSACDPHPGRRDATRANATRRKKNRATNARDRRASHPNVSHPNASRPGLVPRSGGTSRPDLRGPRRPGPRACAWRAAGDRSCPPECPGR